MNFCISGQKVAPTTHTRSLDILMDQNLSWDQHLKMLKQRLSRANGLLAKVRYYLSLKLLRTLYFSIFESHLRYGCQIWGSTVTTIKKILQTYNAKQFELSISKTNTHLWIHFSKKQKL